MKKIDENDSFDNNLDKDIVEYFFGNVKKIDKNDIDDESYKESLDQAFGRIKNCKKNFIYNILIKTIGLFTIV